MGGFHASSNVTLVQAVVSEGFHSLACELRQTIGNMELLSRYCNNETANSQRDVPFPSLCSTSLGTHLFRKLIPGWLSLTDILAFRPYQQIRPCEE
jgi:hypothetical protein